MSTVFLNVGQCGVQLGQAFWTLAEERLEADGERHPFRTIDGYQRRVLVDTEPKVLAKVRNSLEERHRVKKTTKQQQRPHWKIRESNVRVSQRGRGANWAMGYCKAVETGGKGSGHSLLDEVMESVRTEVERCDAFSGFVLTHSLSGGTGSGLGSHLVEGLRNEYSLAQQLSVCVAPSLQGENPMQSYNCALCLKHLHDYCDAILLLENDWLLKCCQEERLASCHRPPTASIRSFSTVTVDDMNRYAAEILAGLLLPTQSYTSKSSGWSLGLEPWELVRSLCPLPTLKILTADYTRQTHARSWPAMAELLSRQHLLYRHSQHLAISEESLVDVMKRLEGAPYRCISLVAVARGVRRGVLSEELGAVHKSLSRGYRCVQWNPSSADLWRAPSAGGARASTTLTVASNSTAACYPMVEFLDRAERMFACRAFLHWYERYDCCHDSFVEAFDTAHTILDNYSQAVT